ncbi:hypothetical protein LCGC14_2696530 [marine sediment metagenome]|uniref:DUF4830 domain-containing protein n=1 Tax=marine sediment metagenome TaxID=412755 RepID=A0A0F8ZH52_9ZZZZ
MSGSQRSRKLKVSELFSLVGLAIFLIVMVVGIGLLAWPQIEENWFAPPTPIADIRILPMTNEEMNNCLAPNNRTLLPNAYDGSAVIPALRLLVKAGIIYEVEPMLEKIMGEEAIPYWVWSSEKDLEFTLLDIPGKVIYRMSLYCITEVNASVYPLYDTVEVEAVREEEAPD